MERRRLLALVAGVLGTGLIGYAFFTDESEEERVRSVLSRFGRAVSVEADQTNPLARLAFVNGEFKETVDPDVHASVPELRNLKQGRQSLAEMAVQSGQLFRTATVEFSNCDIQVGNAGAKADCVGHLTGVNRSGEPRKEERTVHFELREQDGAWMIQSIIVSEAASN
ncbi:MAG: hypothetical protein H6718_15640 [Polyangiaceae bacterium]|nr:hypothetical protein [Myxococcales bacterium]MCB9586832.1 hypothetical protein [Polyangiaceae bacterium]MCB9606339.1 hypothetical protein [Polyangiaceae bacterium]